MANLALLSTGQQAVTTAAVALPAINSGLLGVRVILEALKANSASVFYGASSAVTIGTGKELAPGTQDVLEVGDLSEIFVIAAAGGSSVSFSVVRAAG